MATINGTAANDDLFIGAGISGDEILGLDGDDRLDAGFGAGGNILRGGNGNDNLFANTNDQLFGDAGNDTLDSRGGKGGNTLSGGEGNDTIFTLGNDTATGDAGDDIIYGGVNGGNTLTGGLGRDVFWLANVDLPTSANTITDFNPVVDTLRVDLAGVTQLSDLTIAQSGSDALINRSGTPIAIIKNTAIANLTTANVVFGTTAPNNATVNTAPTISPTSFSINENSLVNAVVGKVNVTDNAGDKATFTITSGNNDLNANGKAPFTIDPVTGEIKVNDPEDLDFERNVSIPITVKVTDTENLSSETQVTVNLTNVTEANQLNFKLSTHDFKNLPKLGTTSKGDDVFLGGFSGLFYQGMAENGNLKFVTHTDRGPNGEPTGFNRPFLLPDFQPEIVSFELNRNSGKITITKRTGLFAADGVTKLTGLPNLRAAAGGLAYTDEVGVDLDGKELPNSPLGADVEGIVIDGKGNYWMVDEYRPAIYQFDVNGKLLNRFVPIGTAAAPEPDAAVGTFGKEVLPAVYAQRRNNRGFEAVAIEGNKLYAFIQSAIDAPDLANDNTSRNSRNLRIVEFDINSQTVTGEYLYLLDNINAAGTARTDKIGDAVSLGNGKFAVVERDDLGTEASNKLIYEIDLKNATNINLTANLASIPAGKTIEQLSPSELITAKINPVSKSLIANAAKFGYTGVEKLEGLALIAPNTYALLNDNDFLTSVPEKLGILEIPTPKKAQKKIDNSAVFEISGGSIGIQNIVSFTVKGTAVTQLSELGLFIVDDDAGSIDGVKIGEATYSEKAIARAKVIFSAIDNNPNGFSANDLIRSLGFSKDAKIRFYSVSDRTTTTDLIFKSKSYEKITFSTVSSLNFQFVNEQKFSINFSGLTINIENSDAVQSVLGTGLQDTREGEVIDLRDVDTALFPKVQAEFTLNREAAFNNFIGFYKVENAAGDIKLANGTTVKVGSADYIKSAVGGRVTGIDLSVDNQATPAAIKGIFDAGSIFAPFIIINSNADAITDSNPNNDPAVYFPFLGANSDGKDHVRLLGNNTFGFEDLPNGGDFDYNDFIVKIKLTPLA
jgi:3-phytase